MQSTGHPSGAVIAPSWVRRGLPPTLLLALVLALPACFTTALWGGEIEREETLDYESGEVETEYQPNVDFSNVRSWADFGACLLLTPLTVLLDIVTSPVQAFLFGWDDDDDDDDDDQDHSRSMPQCTVDDSTARGLVTASSWGSSGALDSPRHRRR